MKVQPRFTASSTVLAPFGTLAEVAQAVPHIVHSGVDPSILEYLDVMVMAGITQAAGIDLGIPEEVKAGTLAYLVVVLEGMDADRVEEDVERLGTLLEELGGASTSTSSRRPRARSSSPPGSVRSTSARRPAVTTSSTP